MTKREYNKLVQLTKASVQRGEWADAHSYVEWMPPRPPRTRNGRRLYRRSWQKLCRHAQRANARLQAERRKDE
jgi:hypothetical protein